LSEAVESRAPDGQAESSEIERIILRGVNVRRLGSSGNVHRHKSGLAIILSFVVGGVLVLIATDAITSIFREMGKTVLRILGTLASAAFNALRHL
jgi:hypothetical protein